MLCVCLSLSTLSCLACLRAQLKQLLTFFPPFLACAVLYICTPKYNLISLPKQKTLKKDQRLTKMKKLVFSITMLVCIFLFLLLKPCTSVNLDSNVHPSLTSLPRKLKAMEKVGKSNVFIYICLFLRSIFLSFCGT